MAGGSAANSAVREVAATATQSLTVDDPAATAASIQGAAAALGGYTESTNIATVEGGSAEATDRFVVPAAPTASWVQVRVPADALPALMEKTAALGVVTASSVTRQDVTDQTADLRARVTATQTAVDRLTQLVAQSSSVADLIAAEKALADREADLASYRQQLTSLETQVSMSSLTVSLSATPHAAQADPRASYRAWARDGTDWWRRFPLSSWDSAS